jgi:hypothetical protein
MSEQCLFLLLEKEPTEYQCPGCGKFYDTAYEAVACMVDAARREREGDFFEGYEE